MWKIRSHEGLCLNLTVGKLKKMYISKFYFVLGLLYLDIILPRDHKFMASVAGSATIYKSFKSIFPYFVISVVPGTRV